MDNQHRQIKGYRDLSQQEIDAINMIKDAGAAIDNICKTLFNQGNPLDQRWVSIGKTHMQQGLMALTRAVAPGEVPDQGREPLA